MALSHQIFRGTVPFKLKYMIQNGIVAAGGIGNGDLSSVEVFLQLWINYVRQNNTLGIYKLLDNNVWNLNWYLPRPIQSHSAAAIG
jgi:hypothetical protein